MVEPFAQRESWNPGNPTLLSFWLYSAPDSGSRGLVDWPSWRHRPAPSLGMGPTRPQLLYLPRGLDSIGNLCAAGEKADIDGHTSQYHHSPLSDYGANQRSGAKGSLHRADGSPSLPPEKPSLAGLASSVNAVWVIKSLHVLLLSILEDVLARPP